VPEKYVTYSFHTSQGKVSTNLVLKKNPTSIEGTSRMGGEWIPPAFTASKKQARGQWWADVKMEDTYGLLNKPCDMRVRFTSLRPADNVFHTWYMPQQKFDGIPKKIPYFFMSLAKPKKRGQPRQFSAIIEPYRKRRAVKSARVIETGRAGVEIIEIKEVSGRTLTFVICPSAGKVTLADGVATKSDVAVVIKAGKGASVHQR
jgi:hypothetical protein